MRDKETGGRLILDINSRRRTTLLKDASVRPRGKVSETLSPPFPFHLLFVRAKLTGEETVQLYQELEIDIIALRGLSVSALHVVAVEIDTCIAKATSSANLVHRMLMLAAQSCRTRWRLARRNLHHHPEF